MSERDHVGAANCLVWFVLCAALGIGTGMLITYFGKQADYIRDLQRRVGQLESERR